MYRIFDIGTVAIFLEEGTGGRIIGLTLPAGEKFPEEFKVGDAVELTNHPSDPAQVAMGHITGFYEITETLVASKGSVRDRAESLGLVHVRVRPKDEDCDEKRSATRSCNGSAFSIHSWHGGASQGKGPNRFKVRRGTAVILMERRDGTILECLVSRKDFHRVRRHHWYANTNGKRAFYAVAWIGGAQVQMHKYLCPNWAQVNHQNGNGLDNSRGHPFGVVV